jgi:hypothetical protein
MCLVFDGYKPANWVVTRGHKASKHLFEKLVPMIEERLADQKNVSSSTHTGS